MHFIFLLALWVRKKFAELTLWLVLGSVFWHQNLRKSLSAPADVLIHKGLRFPKGVVARYLHLSLVFLFSGLMHELLIIAEGVP